MCERHSFCLTRAAKVLDGYGLTDSHTAIMAMHGLTTTQQDACNLYEWQPPKAWPAEYAVGIKVDKEVFETKARHENAIERHPCWRATPTVPPGMRPTSSAGPLCRCPTPSAYTALTTSR